MAKYDLKFYVGTHCAGCKGTVEAAIDKLAARAALETTSGTCFVVESRDMDLTTNQFTIVVEDDRDLATVEKEIIQCIKATGKECISLQDQGKDRIQRKQITSHIVQGLIGLLFGAGVIALTLSGLALPFYALVAVVAGGSLLTLTLGAQSYFNAIRSLFKARALTMDSLFTISTLTVVGVSIASLFVPWLPMMIEAGLLIFGVRHIGKAVEESIKRKINAGLSFVDRAAKSVLKQEAGDSVPSWIPCDSNLLEVDDIIQLKKGDVVPVDCVYEGDDAQVYTTIVNGELEPSNIRAGSRVYAGMVVAETVDSLELKVTAKLTDSLLSKYDRQLAIANARKAPLQESADRILQYFIPGVIILALLTGVVIGIFFTPALAIQAAATIMLAACPCTFGFITPLAVKIGMSRAFENLVKFRNGKELQQAASIDRVVIDCHGTLTKGTTEVATDTLTLSNDDITEEEFWNIISTMEDGVDHHISRAILNCPRVTELKLAKPEISNVDRTRGTGVKANVDGETYYVGNRVFLEGHGINLPQETTTTPGHVIYLANDNAVIGHFRVIDHLRDDAIYTVQQLQNMGIEVYMCTGADENVANYYAKAVGIEKSHVYANCLSFSDDDTVQSKVKTIAELQANGHKVAMLGDGANDAAPLKASDLGIAVLSDASDAMVQENAGAIISSVSFLLPLLDVAKETVGSIKSNLGISIGYNAVVLVAGGIIAALGFALNPAVGVFLMGLQAMLVLGNQGRVRHHELKHQPYKRVESSEKNTTSSYAGMAATLGSRAELESEPASSSGPAASGDVVRITGESVAPTVEPEPDEPDGRLALT